MSFIWIVMNRLTTPTCIGNIRTSARQIGTEKKNLRERKKVKTEVAKTTLRHTSRSALLLHQRPVLPAPHCSRPPQEASPAATPKRNARRRRVARSTTGSDRLGEFEGREGRQVASGGMCDLVARTGRLQQRYEDGRRLVAGWVSSGPLCTLLSCFPHHD